MSSKLVMILQVAVEYRNARLSIQDPFSFGCHAFETGVHEKMLTRVAAV